MGASPRVGRAGSPATNTSQHQFKMSDIRFLDSLQQRRDFQCSYLHKKGTLNSIFQSIESKHFTKLHNRLHDDVAVEKAYNTVPHGGGKTALKVIEYYLRDNRYTTFYEWQYLFFPCAFGARIINIEVRDYIISNYNDPMIDIICKSDLVVTKTCCSDLNVKPKSFCCGSGSGSSL